MTLLVSLWQLFIEMFAYGVQHKSDFLGCMEDGWAWVYTSILGSVFTLFHMMTILMQSILVIKLFYWIPEKMGFYDKDEPELDMLVPFETLAIELIKKKS